MDRFLYETIIPFEGTKSFKLGMKLEDVRIFLKTNKVPFNQTIQSNKDTTDQVPWIFITIDDSITLCFAKDIMYEMYFENKYRGKLPNGGCIGMHLDELRKIDSSICYNDEEEDFSSKEGYWIVDDIDTKKVITLTIFLPEVETEEFYKYEWVGKYL